MRHPQCILTHIKAESIKMNLSNAAVFFSSWLCGEPYIVDMLVNHVHIKSMDLTVGRPINVFFPKHMLSVDWSWII